MLLLTIPQKIGPCARLDNTLIKIDALAVGDPNLTIPKDRDRRGSRLGYLNCQLSHRIAGRGWVALMLVVSISGFFIQTKGHFTWIHLLSVVVPLLLALGVYFAVRGKVRAHRRMMLSVYAGALGVAGAFTLLPHRLLGHLLWTSLGLL